MRKRNLSRAETVQADFALKIFELCLGAGLELPGWDNHLQLTFQTVRNSFCNLHIKTGFSLAALRGDLA
jgi:hypothetical protein